MNGYDLRWTPKIKVPFFTLFKKWNEKQAKHTLGGVLFQQQFQHVFLLQFHNGLSISALQILCSVYPETAVFIHFNQSIHYL